MNLNDLESHVFAYFLATQAEELNIAGRFFPRSDFINTLDDKMKIATRKFGRPVGAGARVVAEQLVDLLVEQGGLSTQKDKFGGVMHQFQTDAYRTIVAGLKASDPIVAKAAASGDGYWDDAFARLVA